MKIEHHWKYSHPNFMIIFNPNNNKSEVQKYWYGNTTKDKLLDRDIKTIENIKEYLEYEAMKQFMRNKKSQG